MKGHCSHLVTPKGEAGISWNFHREHKKKANIWNQHNKRLDKKWRGTTSSGH